MADGRALDIRIVELSLLGCKISTGEMLPVGELVVLEMPGSNRRLAKVRWSMTDLAGLSFI